MESACWASFTALLCPIELSWLVHLSPLVSSLEKGCPSHKVMGSINGIVCVGVEAVRDGWLEEPSGPQG